MTARPSCREGITALEAPRGHQKALSKSKASLHRLQRHLHLGPPPKSQPRVDSPPSELPQGQETSPSTFLSLCPELHLIIEGYLDPTSRHVLGLVPNTRLRQLYSEPDSLSPSERAMASELLTQDNFERTVWAHIGRYGSIVAKKISVDERKVINQTRFYCHPCDIAVGMEHFSQGEIMSSLLRDGCAKSKGRHCLNSQRYVHVDNGWAASNLQWWMIEKARNKLLKAGIKDQDSDADPSTLINATDPRNVLPQDIRKRINIIRMPSHCTRKKTTKRFGRFYPNQSVRLHRRLASSPELAYKGTLFSFEADVQCFYRLAKHWDPSPKKTLRNIRLGFLLALPDFCPHLGSSDFMFHMDKSSFSGCSLLRYMVTGLHSEDLPWKDEDWDENGNPRKRTKSMNSECYFEGCRTEFTLQRAECRVEKKKKKKFGGGGGGDGEEWKQFVWLIVRRRWKVDTPSGFEWRVQSWKYKE